MKKIKLKFKNGDRVWFVHNLNLYYGIFDKYLENKKCSISDCRNQNIEKKHEVYNIFPIPIPEKIIRKKP